MADTEKIVIEIETLIKTGQIDQAKAKLRAFADDVILNNKRIEKSTKESLVGLDRRLMARSGIEYAKAVAPDIPPGFFKKPVAGRTSVKFPEGMIKEGEFVGIPEHIRTQIQRAKEERIFRQMAGETPKFSRWSPEMQEWQAWAKYQKDVSSKRNIEDILEAWYGRTGAGYHRLRGMPFGAGPMYSRELGGLRSRAGFVWSDIASIPKMKIEGPEREAINKARAEQVTPFDSVDDLVTSIQRKLDWMGQQARKAASDLEENEDAIFTPLQGLSNLYGRLNKAGTTIRGAAGGLAKRAIYGPDIKKLETGVSVMVGRHLAGDVIPTPAGGLAHLTAWDATQRNKERREEIKNIIAKYGDIVKLTEKEVDVLTKAGVRPFTMVKATIRAGAQDTDLFAARMAKLRKELEDVTGSYKPMINMQFQNMQAMDQSARVSQRFHELGSRTRKIAWQFTWMSMSMLGVYFSLNNVINLGMKGFSMFTQKLMDLEGTLTAFAMLQAFGALAGLDLSKHTLDIERLVEAWMTLMGWAGALTVAIADLAAEIFTDPDVKSAVAEALNHFAEITRDPEFRESLKDIAKNVAGLAEDLMDIAKWLTPIIDKVLEFKIAGYNVATILLVMWLAAIFLMPILADLAAIFLIAGTASGILAAALGGEGLFGILAGLFSGLTVIIIAVLVVAEAFGLWKYAVSELTRAVTDLIVKGLEACKVLDLLFNAGRDQAKWDAAIAHARNCWEEYNRGLMDTQGGLLSIINYSKMLGETKLPEFPRILGGGSTSSSTNITINNNNNIGGVLLTQDELQQLQYYQTRDNLTMLMLANQMLRGVE